MQTSISPIEKSRQLLKQIEFEEKINRNKLAKMKLPIEDEGTSLEGDIERPYKLEETIISDEILLNFKPLINTDIDSITKGIIYSEILGKPLSKRNRRR